MSHISEKDTNKPKSTDLSDQSSSIAAKSNSTKPTVYPFAYGAICWERFWPLAVPAFIIGIIFLCLSWFGYWQNVSDVIRWISLAAITGALFYALSYLFAFRFPTRGETYRRIENVSGISHRPVTAQIDQPANINSPFAKALWQEHQKRMTENLNNLSAGTPKPDGNKLDPFALRAILPLLAFVAAFYSYGVNGGRISDAFSPRIDTNLVLSRLDVWISPPSYSAKPPIYLSENQNQGESVSTLNGSNLTIRYVGKEPITAHFNQALLIDNKEGTSHSALTDQDINIDSILNEAGLLEITARNEVIASWKINVTKDQAPKISLDTPPNEALSGALELTYSVEDDYGVVSAKGIFTNTGSKRVNARPLIKAPELKLPLPRSRAKKGTSKINRDLSSHPWAGSEVELVLQAEDDPGQIGSSEPVKFILPGRRFVNPMARALVEQRRILANNANDYRLVADMIDAVTTRPEYFNIDPKAYLGLRSAYRMIAPGNDDDKLREGLEILWETALAIELGDLSKVERKLREAQEKLSKALENGASDAEIDELMKELRQAMNDFLEQLAKDLAQNPIQQNPLADMQNSQTLSQRDLEKMMKRIEDLAKSGSKDAARELLSQMQRMMDNLRAGRHQQQRQAEGNQLNKALDKLSELMQKQQELMDKTFSMQKRKPRQGEQNQQGQQQSQQQGQRQQGQQPRDGEQANQGNPQQDENSPMSPEEFADALKQLQQQQEALQKQLSELGEQLGELGLDPSEEFGDAGREMGKAGDNLGKGDAGSAAGNQGKALQALRNGVQSMMQQMAGDRNQGGQQQGQGGQSGQAQSRTDPLGRNQGQGRVNDESTKIPGEIDAQRAREIMDAIRKRLSDPLRPLLERNYLERLLQSR